MAWLDDMIGFFSPKAKLNRIKARRMISTFNDVTRKYEGAAKGRRTEGWKTPATSANAEVQTDAAMLRNRARDLVRNNPYAQRAIRLIGANVVGQGIRANIISRSELQARKFTEAWNTWASTCYVDFDCKHNLYSMQKIVMEAVAESGEVLIRRRFRDEAGVPIPLRLQVLEADFIATNLMTNAEGGNRIIQGIEFDPQGLIVAYHLYQEHPGNISNFANTSRFSVERVPASEILHVFRADRPGQFRGVTWVAPVMMRLRDLDDFEDAQLVRQKIAACFSVFVQDNETHDAASLTDEDKINLGEKVEPGIIEILPPGKTVTFASPPGVTGYNEYVSNFLHSVATGLGVSFEALTGDLSQVNFSSARMGYLEFQRNIDQWRGCILNPMFNDEVFFWFTEAARLAGLNPQGVSVNWIAPRREMIDPTKEVPAKIKAVRAGLETLDDAILQNGKDPRNHLEQIAANNKLLDELELVLDTDPRKVSTVGILQADQSQEGFNDEDEGVLNDGTATQ